MSSDDYEPAVDLYGKLLEQDNHIAELEAENERLRPDAQRYRKLREQDWDTGSLAVVVNPKEAVKLGYDCPSRERLDNLVDALSE